MENGAVELDVVLNIGKLKSRDYDYVKADLQAVTAAEDRDLILMVIAGVGRFAKKR